MHAELTARIEAELAAAVQPHVAALGERLAAATRDALAVLFYGSALRTGDLDGILDFYVVTGRGHRRGVRGLANRLLAPEVGYLETTLDGRPLRAKIATLTLAQFRRGVRGRGVDTTIWARFAQPAALVWVRDAEARQAVVAAVGQAVTTAGRFAAALGPEQATAQGYWLALFQRTYRAELRVEAVGREESILANHPGRYETLLPLAWAAAGLRFDVAGDALRPDLTVVERRRWLRGWGWRRLVGRPLNAARLIKAAFTFDGAARYALWKIERHTGLAIPLTPWREHHPILAAPAVLWRLARARRRGPLG